MLRLCFIVTLSAMLSTAPRAGAALITFLYEGSCSGVLGGIEFFGRSFAITASADTNDRFVTANGYSVVHSHASILIDGVGTVDILSQTSTAVNNSSQRVVFGHYDAHLAIIRTAVDPVFNSWDLTTPIGPIFGTGQFVQGPLAPLDTTNGVLRFLESTGIGIGFEATVVPAPEASVAIVLLPFMRRKRC